MESDALTNFKVDGNIIHKLPAFCDIRNYVAFLILRKKRAENIVCYHNCCDFLAYMGVHGGHVGSYRHH
ncbi:hypothetical protein SDC9_125622 [bioreactor metagenome]|uniref:Uncharacterized protein n=1 Tax=bioreactor metagenome TaxID=1076179 RepID=A0A645CNW0_9ZZZZ